MAESQFLQSARLSQFGRRNSDPFAAYRVGGITPALVADFENDVYLGAIASFADFTESGTVFDTAAGSRRLVVDGDTATVELAPAKLPAIPTSTERLANPTFATDLSSWSENTTGVVTWDSGDAVIGNGNGVTNTLFEQSFVTETGKTYLLDIAMDTSFGTGVRIYINTTAFDTGSYFTTDFERSFVATGPTTTVKFYRFRSHTGEVRVHSVSVRAVPVPSVSIALSGEISYTDTGVEDIRPFWWEGNSSNYVLSRVVATGTSEGYLTFSQRQTVSGKSEIAGSSKAIPPGTNVPFSIASRNGHGFINAAYDGALSVEDVSPIQLFDVSSFHLRLGVVAVGTGVTVRLKRLTIWAEDIGDAGIAEATSPGTQDVIAVIGQSNAVGWDVYDGLGEHPGGVRQWYDGGVMAKASVPLEHVNYVAGNMGLDIAFAQAYRAANPNTHLLFVPAAKGTTGFTANNWNPGDPEYENAVALLNAALSRVHGAQLKGILWVQGENDAKLGHEMTEAQYAAALDTMIAGLRADVSGAAGVPFVAGQIGTFLSLAGYPTRDQVNAAIADLPNRVANTAFVSSSGLTHLGDNVHYDAASLRTLGTGMYAALAGLL